MKTFHRQYVLPLVVALVALIGLCGCLGKGTAVTTEDLLVRYATSENIDNCRADADIDLYLSMMGLRFKVPVKAQLDVAGESAHGTLVADLSIIDSKPFEAEVYAQVHDDAIVYYLGTGQGDAVTWQDWRAPLTSAQDGAGTSAIAKGAEALALTSLLKSAEFSRIALETDEQVYYELTAPADELAKVALEVVDVTECVGTVREGAVLDALKDTKVRFDFAKDCRLRSVSVDADCKLGGSNSPVDVPVTMTLRASAYVLLDDYGEVDPESVLVPSSVQEASSHQKEPYDMVSILDADSSLRQRVEREAA